MATKTLADDGHPSTLVYKLVLWENDALSAGASAIWVGSRLSLTAVARGTPAADNGLDAVGIELDERGDWDMIGATL